MISSRLLITSVQLGLKMSKYLRPQTLFGTKFESYLNEKVRNAPPQRNFSVLKDDTIENIPDDELPF